MGATALIAYPLVVTHQDRVPNTFGRGQIDLTRFRDENPYTNRVGGAAALYRIAEHGTIKTPQGVMRMLFVGSWSVYFWYSLTRRLRNLYHEIITHATKDNLMIDSWHGNDS